MTEHYAARDMWASLAHDARKKILGALQADETLHNHDWAGLPPQVQAGVIAGMPVEAAADDEGHAARGRRKKADDE